MTDITLKTINSGYNLSKINDNFDTIEQVVNEEVLHTVGGNNTMAQELDMNSNKITNLPNATSSQEPITLSQGLSSLDWQVVVGDAKYYDTVALATADPTIEVGDKLIIGERGNGTFTAISGVGTANTFNTIEHDSLDISLDLRLASKIVFPLQWGAKQIGGAFNDLPAIQAAVDYIISQGGGDVVIEGDATLVGVASDDSHLNGILVPFSSFAQDKKVRIIGGLLGGRLRAGSNNIILVRASNTGTVCENLRFEGAGFSNAWAMGAVPENRIQTTTQVSQSYCKMIRCQVDNCVEGFVGEPGPSVQGRDSGAFYMKVEDCDFNLTTRNVWFKGCSAEAIAVGGTDGALSAANRVTRSVVRDGTHLRGNTGIDMEYCTECTFENNYFEFFDVARGGTSPHLVPTAYYIGTKSENNNIFSGAEEACDYGIDNQATSFNNKIDGFPLSGINNNVGVMPKTLTNKLQLTNDIEGVERSVDVTFKNDTFAKLEADSAGTGTKDVVLSTNGADRTRWFNGAMTHIGSGGNIEFNSVGNGIECDGSAFGLTASAGFFRLTAASDGVYLRVGGADIVKVDTTRFRPIADNVTDLGDPSFRWEEVFSGIGAINTSDARVKTEVRPLTVDELNAAKALSKEIGFYQFLRAVEEKGSDAREHVGMTVQRAIEVMESHNLDPFGYGFICYDEWDETPEVPAVYLVKGSVIQEQRGEEGDDDYRPAVYADGTELVSEAIAGREAGDLFSFRPDQLDRFMIKGLAQRLEEAGI